MANQLFQGNKFPGSPFSAFVLIDNGDGSYSLSFNSSFNQTYPSDPTTIEAGSPVKMSPQGGETLLITRDSVDLNTAVATSLYTVPADNIAVITRIVLRNASTSLTTASISFGFNSAAFNNIVANATHTELTGPTLYTVLIPKTGATRGVAADILKVLANTLQGGAATVSIDVFGYLVAV